MGIEQRVQIEKKLAKAREVDFSAINRYVVARHEDTLLKLIDVADKIEKQIDVWFPDGFAWRNYGDVYTYHPVTNVRTRTLRPGILWVWLPGRIQFLYDTIRGTVRFVTTRSYGKPKEDEFKDAYCYHIYRFIDAKRDSDEYNTMRDYLKTPAMDTYFKGVSLNYLSDYTAIVEQVDEDYEYAEKCATALEDSIETINRNVDEYLAEAERLQNKAYELEGNAAE